RGRAPAVRRLNYRLRRDRRVQIDRDVERLRPFQDRREELVVEIAAAGVAVDQCALEALLPDAALQLVGGLVGHRGRQGGKGGEPLRIFLHRLQDEIIRVDGDR